MDSQIYTLLASADKEKSKHVVSYVDSYKTLSVTQIRFF